MSFLRVVVVMYLLCGMVTVTATVTAPGASDGCAVSRYAQRLVSRRWDEHGDPRASRHDYDWTDGRTRGLILYPCARIVVQYSATKKAAEGQALESQPLGLHGYPPLRGRSRVR